MIPYITFVLFTATDSSPPLVILQNPNNLDEELKLHAKEYVRMYVRTRRENFTANVPAVFRIYIDDFVTPKINNPNKVFMKMLLKLAPDRLKSELDAIFMDKNKGHVAVPKLLFDSLNWNPWFIL